MRVRWIVVALLLVVSPTATRALAQEKGDSGLVMGYPTTIGLIWHAGQSVALRPEFNISRSSADSSSSTSSSTATSTGTAGGVGLSGLFYFRKWDSVRAYFSPRYGYTRSSTTNRTNNPSGSASATNTSSSHSVTASIGVQYSVNGRFGVFGEAGFAYSRQNGRGTNSLFENTANTWGTRSAIGAILYF